MTQDDLEVIKDKLFEDSEYVHNDGKVITDAQVMTIVMRKNLDNPFISSCVYGAIYGKVEDLSPLDTEVEDVIMSLLGENLCQDGVED